MQIQIYLSDRSRKYIEHLIVHLKFTEGGDIKGIDRQVKGHKCVPNIHVLSQHIAHKQIFWGVFFLLLSHIS